MTFQWELAAGAHYLILGVTQTGGPSYGVYGGTITITDNPYDFSGLDADHTVRIDFTVQVVSARGVPRDESELQTNGEITRTPLFLTGKPTTNTLIQEVFG